MSLSRVAPVPSYGNTDVNEDKLMAVMTNKVVPLAQLSRKEHIYITLSMQTNIIWDMNTLYEKYGTFFSVAFDLHGTIFVWSLNLSS